MSAQKGSRTCRGTRPIDTIADIESSRFCQFCNTNSGDDIPDAQCLP